MALDKATVAHIATLAHIKLAESEQDKIASELSHILSWVEQLREIEPGAQPRGWIHDYDRAQERLMLDDRGEFFPKRAAHREDPGA